MNVPLITKNRLNITNFFFFNRSQARIKDPQHITADVTSSGDRHEYNRVTVEKQWQGGQQC